MIMKNIKRSINVQLEVEGKDILLHIEYKQQTKTKTKTNKTQINININYNKKLMIFIKIQEILNEEEDMDQIQGKDLSLIDKMIMINNNHNMMLIKKIIITIKNHLNKNYHK